MSKPARRLLLGLSLLVGACLLGLVCLGLLGPMLIPPASFNRVACSLPCLPPPASLGAVEWRLRSVQQADGTPLWSPAPSETFSLAFDGRQVRGTSGCNSYGGGFWLNPLSGAFITCELSSTLMACMDEGVMERERQFMEALYSAQHCERVGSELRIYSAAGQQLLIFEGAR
ncbi:MAG: META domain-containing protein [Anaerolineales bacterium]|nr:META domain-containing protein [Anaerolineales bacterium]